MNVFGELCQFTEDLTGIEAIELSLHPYGSKTKYEACLHPSYTKEEFDTFVATVRAWPEYDSGYGSQELFGTIWFESGTWADRAEYDGSEWWEGHSRPSLPSRTPKIEILPEEVSSLGQLLRAKLGR